mgnify:CR=1 FL=1
MLKIWKVISLVLLIAGIVYAGASIYVNFFVEQPTPPGQVKMPDIKTAAYSVVVERSGNVMLTANYEALGVKAGQRVYVLHGYWEIAGREFRYRDTDITLSEKVLGTIDVKKRTVTTQ